MYVSDSSYFIKFGKNIQLSWRYYSDILWARDFYTYGAIFYKKIASGLANRIAEYMIERL